VDNVLAVPLVAVFTEDDERYVYVQRAGKVEKCTVRIGVTDYQFAEVQQGLREGDVVLLEPPPENPAELAGKNGDPKNGKADKTVGAGKTGKTIIGSPGREGGSRRSGS
jgi:hypothetical protein